MANKGSGYLKPICEDLKLFIETCDGSKGLADATDLFTWINPNVRSTATWIPTQKTRVEVYEILKKVQFMQILNSLKRGREGLFFTPHQIKKFVANNLGWLKDSKCDVFFFFEMNDEVVGAHPFFGKDYHVDLYFTQPNEKPLLLRGFMPRLIVPYIE